MAWVCYRIAFCYCEEKDYISAFYYIDLVKFLDATCFMEWINVLVNSRRMDALGVVETYLEDSEELKLLCMCVPFPPSTTRQSRLSLW